MMEIQNIFFWQKIKSNVLLGNNFIFQRSLNFFSGDAEDGADGVGGDVAEVVAEPADRHHQEVVDASQQRLQQEVGGRVQEALQDEAVEENMLVVGLGP